MKAKTTRGRHFRQYKDKIITGWGDLLTCDHCDARSRTGVLGIGGKYTMLNFFDRGTDFIWSDPVRSKDTQSTVRSFMYLMGPEINVKLVYSDGYESLKAACRQLGILRRSAQP